MHHAVTRGPTVWDSAPISVRLMCLIYQSESWVVSAAAVDKTPPPPGIILLSLPVSPPLLVFHDGGVGAAGVNPGLCNGG